MTKPRAHLSYDRKEFTQAQRKEMLRRSGGECEAVGPMFGLEEGKRCGADLAYGVRFEHVNPDACGGAADIDNGASVCVACWRWKTSHFDQPEAAKTRRSREKSMGLRKSRSRPIDGSVRSAWKKPINGPPVRRR